MEYDANVIAQISTFSHEGNDLEVLLDKGKISYVFEIKGRRYGNAVKVDGRKNIDYVRATIALLINYLETREAAEKRHDK